MSVPRDQAHKFREIFDVLVDNIGQAVVGKRDVIKLALTCLISEGHLLLEDVPGVGKTLLARALANTVAGTQSRIQFTPDLLPTDVTGSETYDKNTGTFTFQRGPIFHSIVVADEINRASPKTQSALLEAMEEGRVTHAGTTHEVDKPFMVIATQNPVESSGTYPLPEAQLDRFLMKTSLGHPDHEAMVSLLRDAARRDRATALTPVIPATQVPQLSRMVDHVIVCREILDYISNLVTETRAHPHVTLGVSPRGALAFVRCAKTWAISQGRVEVHPDDLRDLAQPVLGHRLMLDDEARFDGVKVADVVQDVIDKIAPPLVRFA
jgi:MoxR-like ATPase